MKIACPFRGGTADVTFLLNFSDELRHRALGRREMIGQARRASRRALFMPYCSFSTLLTEAV